MKILINVTPSKKGSKKKQRDGKISRLIKYVVKNAWNILILTICLAMCCFISVGLVGLVYGELSFIQYMDSYTPLFQVIPSIINPSL